MANKALFGSATAELPKTDTVNEAGGKAYSLSPKAALAQVAATGCFNRTYYASAQDQLDSVHALVAEVNDPVFLAKLAVYSREKAMMKDMPVALLLHLSRQDAKLFGKVFARVVDNGRTLRTFVQMLRSGAFGRKGMSHAIQSAVQRWLNDATTDMLLAASIGDKPSLCDVLRLARPTPKDNTHRALFGWLTNRPAEKWLPALESDLPLGLVALRWYRSAATEEEQLEAMAAMNQHGRRIRWDLLADAAKGPKVWRRIAEHMGLQAIRMNLNTLARHEVIGQGHDYMNQYVAGRLSDAEEIKRSRQFPYQFLSAYLNAGSEVPQKIKAALHVAAEIACGSIPGLPGPVVIGLDVSGSMGSPATGDRGYGATSKMRCVDVAALFAAAILRRNPDSLLVPFDETVHAPKIDPSDSILSLAERLAGYGGGWTNCALPLEYANSNHDTRRFVGCILVSDNESWIDTTQGRGIFGSARGTGTLESWNAFVANQKKLNREASPKLVCIDIQPNKSTQAPERSDILNVGGFSDAVFNVVAGFLAGDESRFVAEVEAVSLD